FSSKPVIKSKKGNGFIEAICRRNSFNCPPCGIGNRGVSMRVLWKRWRAFLRPVLAVLALVLPGLRAAGDGDVGPKSEARLRAAIAIWDTAKSSGEPLAPSALAEKNGWISVPLQKTVKSFEGDAVVSNGRILLAARKRDKAVEVYSVG